MKKEKHSETPFIRAVLLVIDELVYIWQNYGAFLETWGAGIRGSASITGLPSGDLDLSTSTWSYQVSLISVITCILSLIEDRGRRA